jgi:hypothetical protein
MSMQPIYDWIDAHAEETCSDWYDSRPSPLKA